MRRLFLALYAALHASPGLAQKQELVIDLDGDAATLDPHVQWDGVSYLFQYVAIYGASPKLQWQPTSKEAMFVFEMKWAE